MFQQLHDFGDFGKIVASSASVPEAKKKKYMEAPEVELPLFWRLQTIFVYVCFTLNGLFQELCWLVRAARSPSPAAALRLRVLDPC